MDESMVMLGVWRTMSDTKRKKEALSTDTLDKSIDMEGELKRKHGHVAFALDVESVERPSGADLKRPLSSMEIRTRSEDIFQRLTKKREEDAAILNRFRANLHHQIDQLVDTVESNMKKVADEKDAIFASRFQELGQTIEQLEILEEKNRKTLAGLQEVLSLFAN